MKKIILTYILLHYIAISAFSQPRNAGIDTVYYFKPGEGQNTGQGDQYYPANIFKAPPPSASKYFQAADPSDVLSIGLDGEIIVGFKNGWIVDKPGPDFIVYENAFFNPVTNKIFAEPGKIAVSQDGVKYYEFPFDSLTLKGCAGVTPTNGKASPFDYPNCGGDAFDIADFGLTKIKYIKITDICRMILNNPNHPYYDAIITGFDLDFVAGLNVEFLQQTSVENNNGENITLIDNPNEIIIESKKIENFEYDLYSIEGINIKHGTGNNFAIVQKTGLAAGLYFVVVKSERRVFIRKIIVF